MSVDRAGGAPTPPTDVPLTDAAKKKKAAATEHDLELPGGAKKSVTFSPDAPGVLLGNEKPKGKTPSQKKPKKPILKHPNSSSRSVSLTKEKTRPATAKKAAKVPIPELDFGQE